MREQILYYAVKYQGEYQRIKKALQNHEPWFFMTYESSYVTIEDREYPQCFKELEFPPYILFYEGDLTLCMQRCCGVIGSRLVSKHGAMLTAQCVTILKQRYVIVSGLAKGVDAMAHYSALDAHTIGVIGCGLDVIYPKENARLYEEMKKEQLILSEYPNTTKPYAYHFPWRNRLIAALSEHIVVVEAKLKSGTMLTVNEALTLNKSIHCFPHDFHDELGKGCNLLISQGADILVDIEDISMI